MSLGCRAQRAQRPRVFAFACLTVLASVVAACGEPSSTPPAAPTATASLEVPPLPPSKPSSEQAAVRNAPPPSTADDDSPLPRDPAAAEAAFQDAKREMQAGNVVKARELFVRSLRLDPAAGTLLNLAMCEEKLGLRDEAIRHYRAAYDDSIKNGRTDRAALAKQKIDQLQNRP